MGFCAGERYSYVLVASHVGRALPKRNELPNPSSTRALCCFKGKLGTSVTDELGYQDPGAGCREGALKRGTAVQSAALPLSRCCCSGNCSLTVTENEVHRDREVLLQGHPGAYFWLTVTEVVP